MSRSVRYKNNNYLDSTSITHKKEILSNILETSEWTLLNSKYNVYYKKTGKIITLACTTTQTINLPDFSQEAIGQLPLNCRPSHVINFPIFVRSNPNVYGNIETSGQVILFNWTASAEMQAGTIKFNVTFPVD